MKSYILEFSCRSESRTELESLREFVSEKCPSADILLRAAETIETGETEDVGEIELARRQALTLPATYRRGWDDRSDIGIGADGRPTHIWRPQNPEDRFDD